MYKKYYLLIFIISFYLSFIFLYYLTYADDSTNDLKSAINMIKKRYQEINTNVSEYTKIFRNICNESAEGGEFSGYYKDKESVKLVLGVPYHLGHSTLEFYFHKEKLFFVFEEYIDYTGNIFGDKNVKISKIDQNRYYIDNSKVILWLNNKRDKVKTQNKINEAKIDEFMKYIKKYQYKYENPESCDE